MFWIGIFKSAWFLKAAKKKKRTGFSRAREKERVVGEYRMRIQCGIIRDKSLVSVKGFFVNHFPISKKVG